MERLQHCYANGGRIDLSLSLDLYPGQAALICGPSGSGKSTFLRALARCSAENSKSSWQARKLPENPRLAMQNPETQLLCTTVEEEIALGLHTLHLSGEEMSSRIEEQLKLHSLLPLRHRNLEMLSMGQKHRVLLAALLAMKPSLLLLDEPFSQLDLAGQTELRHCIAHLKSQGCAVIVSQHQAAPGDPLWDIQISLPPASRTRLSLPPLPPAPAPPPAMAFGEPLLTTSGICCQDACSAPVLAQLDFALYPGDQVHILGENAAGKSTLLRLLAAGQRPQLGEVRFRGTSVTSPAPLARKVLLLPQASDMLLFEETVAREVGFSGRRSRNPAASRRTQEALAFCGLGPLAESSPLCLSHGERHLVALATLLAAGPEVLLLDEPLTGLDDELARHVLRVLEYYACADNMAILLVSHGPLPAAWGRRRFILSHGRLLDA
ncbi:MAG: ATP-binding cassette domain-containing protein [Acidobacteriota bacterium]|nr:ATP-binding cassette domain-containing protein [Acidobacteriota bacterium]